MNYPKYLSHKEVSAAKIAAVDHGADGSITVHLEGGFDNVVISHHDRKHKPAPEKGWYLVQYSDGYISFSPPAAFEEGYAPLGDTSVGIDKDDDEDEDEEVLDAANNHGQGAQVNNAGGPQAVLDDAENQPQAEKTYAG